MTDYPEICILLTTYKRTEVACRTIEALRRNFQWPNISWYISDDGSDPAHIRSLYDAIGPTYTTHFFDSEHRGVGLGMNHCLLEMWDKGIEFVLSMEDDWELTNTLVVDPFVRALQNHPEHGMIRFGYLAANLLGYLVSEEGMLYWRLDNNGETYRFAGHPHLKHRRFHDPSMGGYGYYDVGLAPGMTELSMCGKVNQKSGPDILYPATGGAWGFFGHIGSESLADVDPIG